MKCKGFTITPAHGLQPITKILCKSCTKLKAKLRCSQSSSR